MRGLVVRFGHEQREYSLLTSGLNFCVSTGAVLLCSYDTWVLVTKRAVTRGSSRKHYFERDPPWLGAEPVGGPLDDISVTRGTYFLSSRLALGAVGCCCGCGGFLDERTWIQRYFVCAVYIIPTHMAYCKNEDLLPHLSPH